MGCRTGFYLLTRGLSHETVIDLVQNTMAFVAAFEGDIPGVSEVECGNWREHDLSAARDIAASMVPVLQDWTPDKLAY
jgi:S-ribosylhomocysteine lyase